MKLSLFFTDLLKEQTLRTIIHTTMNNALPSLTTIKDRTSVTIFAIELDRIYNFSTGLAEIMTMISSSEQLQEMMEEGMPFFHNKRDPIQRCMDEDDCKHLSDSVEDSGKNEYHFTETFSILGDIVSHSAHLIGKNMTSAPSALIP